MIIVLIIILLMEFLLLLLNPQPVCGANPKDQHVVFEEVGQVATSLSYLHVAVPLNLTGVEKLIEDYADALELRNTTIGWLFDKRHTTWNDEHFDHNIINRIIKPSLRDFDTVLGHLRDRAKGYRDRLESVKELMPSLSPNAPSTFAYDHVNLRRRRAAPFLMPLLIKGIFGTFHGLYTKRKYDVLKKELNGVIMEQHRLIASARAQEELYKELKAQTDGVHDFLGNLTVFAPMVVLTKFSNMETLIENEIERIWDAVQVAQQHRLSIRLLPAAAVQKVFSRLQSRAIASGNELLLDKPSDLYQIELSYGYDGTDVTLVLHVPMAPRSTTLRLMRFLPFPFTFSKTNFLIPQPARKLFALSSDEPRLSMELSEADLAGCHRVNNLYLCERQGTLINRMDSTCLGSLYGQKFQRAIELCDMKVLPISEQVLQLNNNWFLVYAVRQDTSYITCRNHTSSEIHLDVGINKIAVSPTCTVKLRDHVLHADTALRDANDVISFAFNLRDTQLEMSDIEEVDATIEELREDGELDPSLDDLRKARSTYRRFPRWLWFIVIACALLVGFLLFLAYALVCTHKWMIIKRSLKLIADAIWPSRNPEVLYDITAPPAHALGTMASSVAAAAMARHSLSARFRREEAERAERAEQGSDPAEQLQFNERGVDVDGIQNAQHLAPVHRHHRYSASEFLRAASRRLRGRRQGQPESLPRDFRRNRISMY